MKKYKGMTVNERLYLSGLLDEFDKAVKKKDKQKLIKILKTVELNDSSIQPILKNIGIY